MSSKAILLKKSRLKRGLQFSKSLYFTLYIKEFEPEITAATQLNFDEGNEVGALTRTKFGNGILIDQNLGNAKRQLPPLQKPLP